MFRLPAWSLENLTGCCWAATVSLWPSTVSGLLVRKCEPEQQWFVISAWSWWSTLRPDPRKESVGFLDIWPQSPLN